MALTVADLATQILTGPRLEDKLLWVPVTWESTRGVCVTTPGRAAGLQFAPRGTNAPLPRRSHLDQPAARATLLHSFANHELLALELMAHALLRFPDAPEGFRKGLLTVLHDEQVHLRLYLDRLDDLGMEFGAAPLSSYFWDVVSDAPTPLDFLARLSLCFEQANLDFARTFGRWFAEVGDHESAAVLDQVYRDEIRHVRHGLGWFRRWKDPDLSDWDAWVRRLQLPLSPSRARGTHFDRKVRREVGFDEETIGRLERWRRSRSRPPTLWYCNPLAESELVGTIPARIRSLATDLQLVPVALAAPEDTVVVTKMPSEDWQDQWSAAGLGLPELIEAPTGTLDPTALAHVDLSGIELWGSTPAGRAAVDAVHPRSKRPLATPDPKVFRKDWSLPLRRAATEALSATEHPLLVPPTMLGAKALDLSTAQSLLAAWGDRGQTAVAKAPLGTAGRAAVRVSPGPLPDRTERWILRTLRTQGAVVIEPWLQRTADLSFHFDVDPDGVRPVGWTRFWTDANGRFLAASTDGPLVDLSVEARRLLTGEGKDRKRLHRLGQHLADSLGPPLRDAGHIGPVGVDAMLVRHNGALCLHPAVEINPRWSFGRVARQLGRRLAAPGVVALLRPLELGGPFTTAWSAWQAAHPVVLHTDGRLRAGVVALGDPRDAKARLPVLASSTAAIKAVLDALQPS